ncbi:hypothetical protein [Streptococcus salivarius]|uniref:hypothetical protein n=1 Tax=Streptococcus salivarius TaxID=1304 RepID=UPI001C54162C|nr:hypothetical protein [Streptococcus salivarius]
MEQPNGEPKVIQLADLDKEAYRLKIAKKLKIYVQLLNIVQSLDTTKLERKSKWIQIKSLT